jgi:hypothetical protein
MSQAKPSPEQIERELAALGEAPPSVAELEGAFDDTPEVASVARLVELAEPVVFEDLSELESHRAWRQIEQRLGGSGEADEKTGQAAEASVSPKPDPSGRARAVGGSDPQKPDPSGRARAVGGSDPQKPDPSGRARAVGGSDPQKSGPRRWLSAAFGLAAAAAVIIVVLTTEQERGEVEGPSAEEVAELGEQVRASLRVLDDGKSDSERAAERAAAYERRLAAREERGG